MCCLAALHSAFTHAAGPSARSSPRLAHTLLAPAPALLPPLPACVQADKATADAAELKAGYDKASADATELRAEAEKRRAQADKALHDMSRMAEDMSVVQEALLRERESLSVLHDQHAALLRQQEVLAAELMVALGSYKPKANIDAGAPTQRVELAPPLASPGCCSLARSRPSRLRSALLPHPLPPPPPSPSANRRRRPLPLPPRSPTAARQARPPTSCWR